MTSVQIETLNKLTLKYKSRIKNEINYIKIFEHTYVCMYVKIIIIIIRMCCVFTLLGTIKVVTM